MFHRRCCAPEEHMHDRIRFIAQLLFVITAFIAGLLGAYAFGKEQRVDHTAAPRAVDAPAAVLKLPATSTNFEALRVVSFWVDAGPALWFAKDEKFDARFRDRFLKEYESAAR